MVKDEERLEWETALSLCAIKITKFTEKTPRKLTKARSRDMAGIHRLSLSSKPTNNQQEPPPHAAALLPSNVIVKQPMNEKPYAVPMLPPLPPILGLEGVIANCSVPFEKQLTMSDTLPSQGRLTISGEHFAENLKPMLVVGEELGDGIDVVTYNVEGREYKMKFKIWAGKMVVLTSGWRNFVSDHSLRKDEDFVTIWMFRHTNMEGLYFAITSRRVHGLHGQIRKPKRKRQDEQPRNERKAQANRVLSRRWVLSVIDFACALVRF
ncbi:hypothetical protein Ancab_025086 [Ancistrocladus abbreviatus]